MKKIKSRKIRLIKHKKIGNILSSIVIMLIFFYCSFVSAGINDSIIEKNRIEDIYAITKINEVDRIFYLNIYNVNGRVSYCIDLGVDINSSIYNSTDDFSITNLSDEQVEYIRQISYFGYKYSDHEDIKYYMAAQELIWEYLSGVEIIWSNEMKVNGKVINIEKYKEDILALINAYKIKFEFEVGQTYEVLDDIILYDSNNVLDNYDVVSSKYSKVLIEDNKLVINVGNVTGYEEIILKKKDFYDYESKLYYYEDSQRLISNGNFNKREEFVSFDIKGISVNIKLKDKLSLTSIEASLAGAIYEIYDLNGSLVGVYETNELGEFIVDDLLVGEYLIKQIKASLGYSINNKINNLIVKKDTTDYYIIQQIISNRFIFKKIYGSNGFYQPESLATFIVYDSKNNFINYVTTNLDGVGIIRLPYGSYLVKQLSGKNGYYKVDDFVLEVREFMEISEDVYVNLIDELICINIKINSYIKDSGEKLLSKDFSYKIKNRSDDKYLEIDGKSIFEVDDNGYINIPKGLPYGDYILEQVNTPNGVLLNSESLSFTINDKTKIDLIDGRLVMELDIYNELIKGRVNVIAMEEVIYKDYNSFKYEKIVRKNGAFELIANEDIIENGKIIFKAFDKIYNGNISLDGKVVIDNLALGNYCLIDQEFSVEKCFEVISDNNKERLVEVNLEIINLLEKRDIVVNNKDINNNNISDSLFELVDSDGIVIYSGISNEDGIINIGDVLIGNYCINQKKVNEKYLINNKPICFSLEDNKSIDFINDVYKKEVVKVPDTMSKIFLSYEFFLGLIIVAIVIFVYKKVLD